MDETDSNELEAQIREALARKRPVQPARPAPPPAAPSAAPAPPTAPGGLVVDPNERLGAQPPQIRVMGPGRAPLPVAGAGAPAAAMPPAGAAAAPAAAPPGAAAAAADGRQALDALMARSAAGADGDTQIPPPPGQVLGRIGVEQQPATPKEKEKPFRHPFFSGRRHLWPMLVIPFTSVGVVIVLFYFLNFELAGEGVVDIAPLIEAEETPIKERPTEEGGLEIPNQDKTIYDELTGETAGDSDVEQLVPPPEEPVVPEASEPVADAAAEAAAEPALPSVAAPDPTATAESTATEAVATGSEPAVAPATEEPAADDATATEAEPAAAPEPAIVTETAALPPGAFRIQLAAVRSEDGARATWNELQGKLPELAGLELFIERIDLGGDLGVFYRVQGGPLPDQAAAYDLCSAVAVRGQECLVVKP